MKIKKLQTTLQLLIILIALSNSIFAQKKWSQNPFEHKVFIENKGQFDWPLQNIFPNNNNNSGVTSTVLYGASTNGVDLFFSTTGLIYKHDALMPMTEDEKADFLNTHPNHELEANEEGGGELMKLVPQYIAIEWVNANPKAEVIHSDAVPHYYTYSNSDNGTNTTIKANAFKRILYKNIYPNIDIEYVFPKDSSGIKYSFILRAGANVSDIKMRYKNAENIHLTSSGNMSIQSRFGEFVDHAPITFYAGSQEKISSAFSIKNNIISFSLSAFDNKKEIIIDPWLTNPAFANFNAAYDVNYDTLGNVYVLGSYAPFKLAKYNNAGALQWTYNLPATFGQPITFPNTYGDFALDEVNGTSFIGEGYNTSGTGSRILKVNNAGTLITTFPGNFGLQEIWRMEYNTCINKIVMAGGGHITNQAGVIDTALTALTAVNILGSTGSIYHDFVLLGIDNLSDTCFMATARPGSGSNFNNVLIKAPLSTNLLPSTNLGPSRHRFGEVRSNAYINDYNVNTSGSLVPANGTNGMAVSPNYFYTYDSDTLKRWNKTTGAYVAGIDVNFAAPQFLSASIQVAWGGLAVDECENIYVGFMDTIKVYNSSLVLDTVYALNDTVYDIKLGPNDKLYACGRSFVTEIALPPIPVNITKVNSGSCTACNGTATVNACFVGGSDISYSWSTSPVQTTATATGLCPGTYTVTIRVRCDKIYTDTVTIFGTGGTVSYTNLTATICQGKTYPLPWPPFTAVGSSGVYTDTLTNQAGCDSIITLTLTVTPAPVINVNASICSGDSYTLPSGTPVSTAGTYNSTITTPGGCDTIISTTLTVLPVSITTLNVTICAGMTYTLPVGGATGVGGTYIDTLTNINGCDSIVTINLTVTPAPVSNQSPEICEGEGFVLPTGASASSSGVYNDTITTTAGCDSVIITNLTVKPSASNLEIPNVFTPNNDGKNDYFQLGGSSDCISEFRIIVYNRWGLKIFESTKITSEWDGRISSGAKASDGTYFYIITIKTTGGEEIEKSGFISLLR